MSPIMKGVTQCYQCVATAKQETFPVCTIRQKPEKTIHCITWAKALFEGLYGEKGQQNIIEDIIDEITKARTDGNVESFVRTLFDKMFFSEPDQVKSSLQGRLDNSNEVIEEKDRQETEAFVK